MICNHQGNEHDSSLIPATTVIHHEHIIPSTRLLAITNDRYDSRHVLVLCLQSLCFDLLDFVSHRSNEPLFTTIMPALW